MITVLYLFFAEKKFTGIFFVPTCISPESLKSIGQELWVI